MLGYVARRLVLTKYAEADVVRPNKPNGHRPSVSVLIPCFNYGHYLTQCVRSVLSQQDVLVDILIIDDASTDGSDQIVRRLGEQDSRIRTICHTVNKGNVVTCNEGIEYLTGDYTMILSADDVLPPGSLARATALMEEHPSVGLTYGPVVTFTDGDLPAARTTPRSWIIWEGNNWIRQLCKNGTNAVDCAGVLMRTSAVRGLNHRADLPHAAEFELWMQLAKASDIGYIAGADQGFYRIHASNMHHSLSPLFDFSQRLDSFDSIFSERTESLGDVKSMRETAHRAIARLALSQGIRDTEYRAIARSAFSPVVRAASRSGIGDESADEYIAFASKAWPDAACLREWRTLHKMTISDDSSAPVPLLIARMAMRKLKIRSQLRRRKFIGV